MKKILAMLLVLALCMCGCSAEEIYSREALGLPAIPTQMTASDSPAIPQDSAPFDDNDTEADDHVGETYPWEKEFNPAGYTVLKETFGGGRAITWINGYKKGRSIVYYNDGRIEDSYFYPSGAMSHMCTWLADGSYSENRWLDNGEVVTMDDGTQISHLGTMFYGKTIHADGSWEETQFNSQGMVAYRICQLADISYQEEVYYENGQMKYYKYRTPDEEQEYRYDEEGFVTYYHTKQADYEIELIADESGKLVKVIENGQTIEDPTALAQYVTAYNFRN